jgi:endonuclease/exonuclease/phosphatase family metal-dependent hydrolase
MARFRWWWLAPIVLAWTFVLVPDHTTPVSGRRVEARSTSGDAAPAPDRPLRLLTFNLLHGGPVAGLSGNDQDLEARLSIAIAELRALDADVIALQEAAITRWRGDVPARVASALGFHHAYVPATERVSGFPALDRLIASALGFRAGPAIVSRFPIETWEVYDLPRCTRGLDPRVLLRAALSTPWGTLDVYSTHTTRGDECQVRRVGQVVRARRGPYPAFVMGDFNADESSSAIAFLTGPTGFVDVFRRANPATAGLTVWQRIDVPTSTVFRRVDYLFLLDGIALAGRVRSSRVVLDTPGPGSRGGVLWPSDHYGVIAEVDLVRRQP